MYTCAYTCMSMCIYMYVCIGMYVYIYIYTHMCVYTYIYIYIYIYVHIRSAEDRDEQRALLEQVRLVRPALLRLRIRLSIAYHSIS